MSLIEKGVEIEVNKTKPMNTTQWKEHLSGFERRWDELAEDKEELNLLKSMDKMPKETISKKEKRIQRMEERLLNEQELHFATYHEKGKKRRASSSKIEASILTMLEGKDKEKLTEMISKHRSQGIAITKFLREKNVVTTKTKNGGDEVEAYPTCSTKWDNDNEVS
tara:strand:+ start:7057 stop:7554 length:498 start_codon:yes stop_codon:yes gene_type:complete